jgi:hypothetical protein
MTARFSYNNLPKADALFLRDYIGRDRLWKNARLI